ncbi:hypothetical protein TRAPUB_9149 [Trametes pubescens]|uniref:DUF6533 domain-containing protein n=1 Tax=Trametes pubescens TaxID=154538 RepID=A0A1M2W367_TRAPU|nr:hypothetical protein TRAPUB_9149 [Trametes pubescens]
MVHSDNDPYLAEIVAGYSTVITVVTCNITVAVPIFYDYVLPFDQEARIIWRARFSSLALLFYIVRYAAFFSFILIVLDVTAFPFIMC